MSEWFDELMDQGLPASTKHKKPIFNKRKKTVDGEVLYRCSKCGEHKAKEDYYKRNGLTMHGKHIDIQTYCKVCSSAISKQKARLEK